MRDRLCAVAGEETEETGCRKGAVGCRERMG